MKFIVAILLTALLGYTAYLYYDVIPWWGFAIGAFLAGWIVPQKAWLSWVAGFTGMFLCWGVVAWNISQENNNLLAEKMAQLLGQAPSASIMIIATALMSAIVGGFAALTGAFVRKKPVLIAEK